MTLTKPEPTKFFRWTVLVFISLAMFGNYYIYDSISPVADLLAKQLGFTDANIGQLQAIYSIPNVFMVLIGGLIIDRIGTVKSSLIFASLCALGAIVTAATPNLYVMLAGRLIFGLGAESLIVAVTTIVAVWFKGKELSLAFGLNLTIARLGSFAALNSPSWGKSYYNNWQDPLMVSVWMGAICILSIVVYMFLVKAAQSKFTLGEDGEQDKVELKSILTFNKSFWYITALCVVFYSAMFPFQTFAVKFFKDVHLTAYGDDIARSMGGFLSSMLTLAAMVLTPLFGLLSDKIGKRSVLMMLGSTLIIPVYLMMMYMHSSGTVNQDVINAFSASGGANQSFFQELLSGVGIFFAMIKTLITGFPNLFIPMVIMGIAFSLIPAVMWPSVSLIVDKNQLGTAYGAMTMIQNIGLAGFNFIIGWANDSSGAAAANPGGYALGMWIFSSLGFLGLFFAYQLKRSDSVLGGVLDAPMKKD